MNYLNNYPLKNILFFVYLPLVVTFMSISVCSNMYLHGNTQKVENNNFITTLNQLSNNALAILFMPGYFSYRTIVYIYNNFDMIMEQLMLKIQLFFRFIFIDIIYKLIILNICNFIEYAYTKLFVPFIRFIFIDVIYKLIILNIYNFIEYAYTKLFVPFIRFIFIDVIYKLIILNIYNFIEYTYTNLLFPLLRFIFVDVIYKIILVNIYNCIIYIYTNILVKLYEVVTDAIVKSFYQILELLKWSWNLFLDYLVYPVMDIISYLHSLSTNAIYNMYIKISDTLSSMYNTSILVFNYTIEQISNTLANIWNSLAITFNNVYDNITISFTQTWARLANMF